MARDSLAFYAQVNERLSPRVDPGFRPCGYVFVAHEAETFGRLRDDVSTQNSIGIPSPGRRRGRAGSADSGAQGHGNRRCQPLHGGWLLRPSPVRRRSVRGSGRSLGVTVAHAEVRSIEPYASRWRLRFADGAHVDVERAVVATSVDTARSYARSEPTCRSSRRTGGCSSATRSPSGCSSPLVVAVDRRFAAKQLADGRVLVSDLGATASTTAMSRPCDVT